MRIRLISFTGQGAETAERLAEGLLSPGYNDTVEVFCFRALKRKLTEFARESFESADALIFVGAAGIAVRAVAPYIKSKTEDPAVLVVDELGKFVIPILSGHIGGANELAGRAAAILSAIPVITTATDLHHAFAVDVFAKEHHLALENMEEAKRISAAVLAGEKIGFFSDFEVRGELPDELTPGIWQKHNLYITQRKGGIPGRDKKSHGAQGGMGSEAKPEMELEMEMRSEPCRLLRLIPRSLVLGMGCRKGVSVEAVRRTALEAVSRLGVSHLAIGALATVDRKREEEAFLQLSKEWRLDFRFFSAEDLEAVDGSFQESNFVRTTIGVGNVCERAAVRMAEMMAGSMDGRKDRSGAAELLSSGMTGDGRARLLLGKLAMDGVTAAIAALELPIVLHVGKVGKSDTVSA